MKRKKNKPGMLLCLIGCVLFFASCGSRNPSAESLYDVYYLNKEETKIIRHSYEASCGKDDTLGVVLELLGQLQTAPKNIEEREAVDTSFTLLGYQLVEGRLMLDFDDSYKAMQETTEVLVRAAIVRTLTQINGVEFVSFTVRGEPLADTRGHVIGEMKADMFIDNAGDEINAYEKARLHLYFADAKGTGLILVNRDVVYNSNISLEKLVIEELIKGPTQEEEKLYGVYPLIGPHVKLLNATVKDGICYANFDESFLTQSYRVTSEVTVYALTNSLVELANVNKIQISIQGETDVMYRESLHLTTVFERNLELVQP